MAITQTIKYLTSITMAVFCLQTNAQQPTDTTKTIQIEEVIVTGTRFGTDVRHLPMSISVVTQKQLNDRQIQSVFPLLNEQVPGFFVTSRGSMGYGVASGAAGAMRLRGIGGAPTTGILMLIDGEPQYMGIMGHPIADVYQSPMVERIEVIRGPASVLYGSNAMGGVINIVTQKPTKDTIHTHARVGFGSFNTLESSVANRMQKGRFNSKASVSYNKTDGHRKNMDFDQLSGNAVFGYQLAPQWHVNANLTLSQFNSSNPGTIANPIEDNDANIMRGMSVFSLDNRYDKTSGALRFYYNCGHHEINDGYATNGQPRNYRFHSYDQMAGFSWFQTATLLPNNRITFGIDYQNFGGEAKNKFTNNSQVMLIDTTLNEIAGYASIKQGLGAWLTLDAGLRYDVHSKTGGQWIPQAGAAIHLPRTIELKAIVSKGFRNPTLRELYMFPPQNPNLLPEEVMNYEVSLSQKTLNNSLFYNVTLFYLEGKNLIQTVINNGRPQNTNIGEVKNQGIEVNANFRINKRWQTNANYSWLSMEKAILGAPQHKIFAGIDYTERKFTASAGVQYISGLYTILSPEELETFCLLSMRASYQLSNPVTLFLTGENLLNQAYEVNSGFPMPKATVSAGLNIHF